MVVVVHLVVEVGPVVGLPVEESAGLVVGEFVGLEPVEEFVGLGTVVVEGFVDLLVEESVGRLTD